jgi:hypothetical protein
LAIQVTANVDHIEPGCSEDLSYCLRIVHGIAQLRNFFVGRIADHERHALVGKCSRAKEWRHCGNRCRQDQN